MRTAAGGSVVSFGTSLSSLATVNCHVTVELGSFFVQADDPANAVAVAALAREDAEVCVSS